MVSSISDSFKFGSIVVILLANIDLPEPGGPINKILCPPAAAISMALFAICCPITSEKSKVFLSYSFLVKNFLLTILHPF